MPDPISWAFVWPYFLAAFAGGYFLGSLPFGLLLTKMAGLGDIRQLGSGNIGTTNVLRTGRKDLAAATLLLDGGKGAAAVLIAGIWGPDVALLAGLGAVHGHLFPIWLKFKGGKAVATTLGTLLALDFAVGVGACLTWLAVALIHLYYSLSGLLAVASAPVFAWFFAHDLQLVEMAAFLAVLVWFSHRENIGRLLRGEEPKIGKKKT